MRAVAISTAFLFVLACGGGGGGQNQNGARTPQWVVFATDDPGGIYATRDNGDGDPVNLSADLTLFGPVSVSSDRRRVLMRAMAPADTLAQNYVRNVDGSGLTRVSTMDNPSATVFSGSWSPRANSLIFIADGNTAGVNELYLVEADGTDLRRINGALNPGESVWQRHWSPDGQRIAYALRTTSRGAVALGIYDIATDSRVRVDIPVPFDDIAWSPTSEKLAFIRRDTASGNPAFQMYTLNADGTGLVLSNGPLGSNHFLSAYAWSPDGERLAQLFRVREPLFNSIDHAKAFINTYDLPPISLSTRVVDFPVTSINLNPGECFALCGFSWSYQGTELAYLTNNAPSFEIEAYSYDIDDTGIGSRKLEDGFPANKEIRVFLGSTGHDRILVYQGGASGNTAEIVEFAVPGSSDPATRISENGDRIHSHVWSSDHERFFAIRQISTEHIIEVRNEDAFDDPREILSPRWSATDRVLRQLNLSLDERNLVYIAIETASPFTGQLRSTPVSGGPARLISGSLNVERIIGY